MRQHLSIVLWGNIFYCWLLVRNRYSTWRPQMCFSHRLSTRDEAGQLQECTQWLHSLVEKEQWQGYSAQFALPWHTVMLQQLALPRSFAHSEITREIQEHLAHLDLGDHHHWTIDYQRGTERNSSSAEITYAAVPSTSIQQWKEVLFAAQLQCRLIDVDVCAVQRLLIPNSRQLFFLQQERAWVLVIAVNAVVVRVHLYANDQPFLSYLQAELQWAATWSGKAIEQAVLFPVTEPAYYHELQQFLQEKNIQVEYYMWPANWTREHVQNDAAPVLHALSKSTCR